MRSGIVVANEAVIQAYTNANTIVSLACGNLGPALAKELFKTGVAFLLILGFPLAMIFAWAWELTPGGLKKEKDLSRSETVSAVADRDAASIEKYC